MGVPTVLIHCRIVHLEPFIQWEFQDPKMGVLYHIRHYKAIFSGDIPLHRPYIGLIYGRYLQFRILKWPLIHGNLHFWKASYVDGRFAVSKAGWWLTHPSEKYESQLG